MYVVEMHYQLYGPFDSHTNAYEWGERNKDPKDPPGKRFIVRAVNKPSESSQ
jgi:hypothetical protein